jgi:hypothetical protein
MALEPEDRKDPKRARVVLSKGHEVVGSGYSRVSGVAAKVTEKKENSGNHGRVKRVSKIEQHYLSRVNRVSQNSNTDWQADWVGRVTRISPSSSMDRQTNQASRVSSVEKKTRGSSRVANTKVRVTENSTNTESRAMENSANTENRAMENSANTESWVTENFVDTKNWVIQDSGGKKPKKEKVLLQSKGQLHGGVQGVLPRHKNTNCKRCIKESWARKKKRKSGTIGLTVYSP